MSGCRRRGRGGLGLASERALILQVESFLLCPGVFEEGGDARRS